MAIDAESREGRSGYIEETAGAYHAVRLGVLEHLDVTGQQAKALVLGHVSEAYWGPVGVCQIRESIRNCFDSKPATPPTFSAAIRGVCTHLPVGFSHLRRASTMAAGRQARLSNFD
ncbi:MAG: hypothetical protein J07HQX50_00693 [Haloquadratum sp. J07HQX50]|jgi:Uncharacterized conserved protein|nr:MAG: hypothetical protein J07HQX50_00693 [Haloquadratum sp. J07HQX50]